MLHFGLFPADTFNAMLMLQVIFMLTPQHVPIQSTHQQDLTLNTRCPAKQLWHDALCCCRQQHRLADM